ncbi:MAG: selenide, water dikinase SelD [Rhodopirellula sp.]|nr:selenide, water dikinase SelD [Rhodopirellula sp.]
MDERLASRDIVLIGAGHTNMHIVRMWKMAPIPDTRLTLISPFSRATYSGMLPGTLAGLYEPDEMVIDLFRFAAPAGIRVIIDEVIGLDPDRHRVNFATRPPIRFDVASVGIGSVPADANRWSDSVAILPIKPMATFRDRLQARLNYLAETAPEKGHQSPLRVVIVGGGAAGVEIALCLEARLRSQNLKVVTTLVDSGSSVLRGYLSGSIQKVTTHFAKRGIEIRLNVRVENVTDASIELSNGQSIEADLIVWTTGATPPKLIENIPLSKGDDGFLAVRNTLQSIDDKPIFAVGDSATLIDSPVRKSGVYAVREGPFLWENLQRFLDGQTLKPYVPQSGFLSLLADGEGGSFLDYKGISAHGRWAWRLKDHIDRKFMRMYQKYQSTEDMPAQTGKAHLETKQKPVMRCRGCGGKAGAGVLRAALERIGNEHPNRQHNAVEYPEDAAMLDPQSPAEMITIDFFQSFMDDPWLVGRVAALNSLSDIWATGGKPTQALAMVQLQAGNPRQQTELLYQVLSGCLCEFDRCAVELLGGHTTEASELTVGFTVMGTLAGQPALLKAGAISGDLLILTKALGTGTLLAGIPQARTRGEWVDSLVSSMLQANDAASIVAREAGAHAVTDVTGFGLAGHLLEILDASGLDAELRLSNLPLLPGAKELLQEGLESTLAPANRETEVRTVCAAESMKSRPEFAALFDPQTSGGLLLSVAAEQEHQLHAQLRKAGVDAWTIGQFLKPSTAPTLSLIE